MAQELMRTAELPPKLGWTHFDFKVDAYDPYLDDLESFLASGQASKELLSSLLSHSLERHVTVAVRHQLMLEIEKRLVAEVRLDLRQLGQAAIRAMHHLQLPLSSVGLAWQLYPRYLTGRIQERRQDLGREASERSAEESALADALSSGKGDPAALAKSGARALGILEQVLWGWVEKAPPDGEVARKLVALAGEHPGRRAARMLAAVFYTTAGDLLAADVRAALGRMPAEAREIVVHHLTIRDPEPKVRRLLFAAAADLKERRLVPLMVADALGAGPWSQPGEGAVHAEESVGAAVRTGDRRVVPMVLHVMSQRPPKAEVRQAVVAVIQASPLAAEFAKALEAQDAGRPVVVPRDHSQEEFLQQHGTFTPKMDQAAMNAEVRRVSAIWESCWHEALDWRRPKEVLEDVGPREKDLLGKLASQSRTALGRLQGHPQVAALEAEFKTTWMTTPQNDVSGRIPLAIILDERASRGADPEEQRRDRETEAADLYAMAIRAHEAKMDDEAKRLASAILQLEPAHPFATDFLERLERGSGIPGIDAGAEAASGPSIILPP